MTENEFRTKSLCFLCSYGDKVYNYVLKLSRGEYCEPEKQEIIIAHQLLNIFMNFDVRDLPDFDEDYNNISAAEMEDLIIKLEQLL